MIIYERRGADDMCLAIPGKILELGESGENRTGRVQFGGITREVSLAFVPEARIGDYVVVHAGFAISQLDAEEARRTYELLEKLGQLQDELDDSNAPAQNAS